MNYWLAKAVRRHASMYSGANVFYAKDERGTPTVFKSEAFRFPSDYDARRAVVNGCWRRSQFKITFIKVNVTKLSPDEKKVLAYIRRRLLQGQKTYGPLDLKTSTKDWKAERVDEIADLLIYSAFEVLKKDLPAK